MITEIDFFSHVDEEIGIWLDSKLSYLAHVDNTVVLNEDPGRWEHFPQSTGQQRIHVYAFKM